MDLERERLREANNLVEEAKVKLDPSKLQELSSLSERLPGLLINSGLLLTVAYLMKRGEGKGDKPESLILNFMANWLKKRGLLSEEEMREDLLKALLELDASRLPALLDEAIALAEALKFVAVARLGKGKVG